jgi:hypothetical protein
VDLPLLVDLFAVFTSFIYFDLGTSVRKMRLMLNYCLPEFRFLFAGLLGFFGLLIHVA